MFKSKITVKAENRAIFANRVRKFLADNGSKYKLVKKSRSHEHRFACWMEENDGRVSLVFRSNAINKNFCPSAEMAAFEKWYSNLNAETVPSVERRKKRIRATIETMQLMVEKQLPLSRGLSDEGDYERLLQAIFPTGTVKLS